MQHFLLQEYKKIDTYLTMISDYLKSPVELSAELTVLQMIGIGVAAIAGGAVVVMAGPGVMALGAVEAMKVVAGSAMTGVLAKTLMGEQLVDKNYEQVLFFIVQALAKVWENDEIKRHSTEFKMVSDYRLSGDTYSLEKALLLLYNPSEGSANFKGTDLSKCNQSSLEKLLQRIESIKVIHEIRNLLAKQCFIGVVGIQDAGLSCSGGLSNHYAMIVIYTPRGHITCQSCIHASFVCHSRLLQTSVTAEQCDQIKIAKRV